MDCIESYKQLKKIVTEKYQEEELTDTFSICDSILIHLSRGDLDDAFFAQEDENVISLVKKYQHLCFYDGDVDNWLDSVEGPYRKDEVAATVRILDNYRFLTELAKEGGEPILAQISSFQDCEGYADSSVVDYLRSTFGNDMLLKSLLTHMCKPEALYQIFTDEQKASLLKAPEGTLYYYGEGGIRFTHPLVLSTEIYRRIEGQEVVSLESDSMDDIAMELTQYFHREGEFSSVAMDMANDYQRAIHKMVGAPTTDMINLMKDMQGEVPKTSWLVDESPLGEIFETPFHPVAKDVRKK